MKKFIKIMKFVEKHLLAVVIAALFLVADYLVIGLCLPINPGQSGVAYLYTLFVALTPCVLWIIAGFAWMIIYNFLPESVTQTSEAEE